MSRILPSQAVAAIEALFPALLKPPKAAEPPPMGYARAKDVSAALAVLAEVPSELLQPTGSELGDFSVRLASLTIARICSSVNLLPFVGRLLNRGLSLFV
jgi:hypothetical protein